MFNEVSAGRRRPTMDHRSSSLDAEFVTGEASVQQNPNPVPAPPGSPEMEFLRWQRNSSFMANEQPPAGHYLPAPAAPDNYLRRVGMLPSVLPRLPLVIPASLLLAVPLSEPPPPPPPAYPTPLPAYPLPLPAYPLPLPRERDYQLEAGTVDFLAQGGDYEGEQRLLDEQVTPPRLTLSDVMAETCILQKKIKMMKIGACRDESGMMTVMPKVTATGDGEFGKKIEGFMFEYEKKGEVGLMCFCHGYILTPAEFIKHAGGTPVSDPLTQIQVYINPTARVSN